MKYVALTTLLLLALAACSFGSSGPSGAPHVVSGTHGVLVEVEDMPDEYFAEEHFDVLYAIENKGLENVTLLRATAQFDSQYLKFAGYVAPAGTKIVDGSAHIPDIIAADRYGPGHLTYLHAQYKALPITRGAASADTTVALHTCYPYKTKISTEVCIEQDRLQRGQEVACTSKAIRPSTSGSPVVIESIETRTSLIKNENDELEPSPSFRIEVRDAGKGLVGAGCVDDPRTTDPDVEDDESKIFNRVHLKAFLLTEELDCDDGFIHLSQKRGQIVCRLPENTGLAFGEGNYESLLNIEIAFAYRDSILTEVTILNE